MIGFDGQKKNKPFFVWTPVCDTSSNSKKRLNLFGFTLIEIMVSIAIIGLLITLAVPFFMRYRERARVAVAISDIKTMEAALYNYYTTVGEFPDNLAQINLRNIKDPWGFSYQYLRIDGAPKSVKASTRKDHFMVPVNSDFDLYSKGRDGVSVAAFTAKSSQDDVVRAFNGGYCGKVADM